MYSFRYPVLVLKHIPHILTIKLMCPVQPPLRAVILVFPTFEYYESFTRRTFRKVHIGKRI